MEINSMRLILCALLLLASVAKADNKPLLIENSRSPDRSMEIWIQPDEDNGTASGTAEIRLVKAHKVLGTFRWLGFGSRADATAFAVLWRPDSKAFAIKWEITRGWMTGAVYAVNKRKRWVNVKLPSDDYVKAIQKPAGVAEFFGKGCDVPEKWLSNENLQMLLVDRNLVYDHEDLEKEFLITLRVADRNEQPLPIAKIVSSGQKSREETERDLQSR